MVRKNLLITGRPGIGKTTVIIKLSKLIADLKPAGFYTEELRRKGKREGFKIKSLRGKELGLLAHTDVSSPLRVGRYGVLLEEFEKILSDIRDELASARVVIIDEIGKMECYSQRFKELIRNLLDSGSIFVATLSERGGGFLEEVRARKDIELIRVTEENRDTLPLELEGSVRALTSPDARESKEFRIQS